MIGEGNAAHLHPYAIVVIHAAEHLTEVVRIDLVGDPREVLHAISWSPVISLQCKHLAKMSAHKKTEFEFKILTCN